LQLATNGLGAIFPLFVALLAIVAARMG